MLIEKVGKPPEALIGRIRSRGSGVSVAALSLAVALMLWGGGMRTGAEVAFAACIGAAAAALPARPNLRDPVLAALTLLAAANAGAAAVAGRSGAIAPALVSAALPLAYVAAFALSDRARVHLMTAVAAVAAAVAAAGITALLLHRPPDAERIGGIWRAGGTLEYPPAMAVVCVCGLVAALALRAAGRLEPLPAAGLGVVLVAGLVVTYDRAGIVMGILVALRFGLCARSVRLATAVLAAGLVVAALAIAAEPPTAHQARIELTHAALGARSDVWSDAWRGFRRRPLEGYGPGGFTRIYATGFDATQTGLAHDLPLEQAVEAGVVAGAAALLLVAAGLWRSARGLAASDPIALGFACIGAVMTLSSLYDFTWSYPPLALLGLAGLAGARAQRSA